MRRRYYDATPWPPPPWSSSPRARDPDALRAPQGPAPDLRAADDPLAGARRARRGRERVVVVDNPERRLAEHLPDGVEVAIQEQPLGTGDAVKAAHGVIDPAPPVVVINGDMPLITAEAIAGLSQAHETPARPRRWPRWSSTTRRATGAWSATPRATSSAWSRPRRPATRPRRSSRSARSTRACTCSTAARCSTRSPRLDADNAQGELYLPDVLPRPARGRDGGQAIRSADPELALGVNDRVDLAHVTRARPAAHPRAHQRAGVTIVDPASTLIEADVTIGADTDDRALDVPARRDPDRRGCSSGR